VESEEGQGATFTIRLPVSSEPETTTRAAQA
jgi:signal transduction histidine kinase